MESNFDIGNRLQQATGKARYYYDGHGRRTVVAYDDGSWKFQISGSSGKLLYSLHPTQGATNHIYLGERLVAEQNSVTGRSYAHVDALGSPVARTGTAGQFINGSRTRYEPYGAAVAGTLNPDGVGFTGHVNDVDTGLVYMQQRYYEPLVGRFLSVDPVTADAKTGDHFNRYVYAENNPYLFVDPDGRAPCTGTKIGECDGAYPNFVRVRGLAPASAARPPAAAANAPAGPLISPTWREIEAVGVGVVTAASVLPPVKGVVHTAKGVAAAARGVEALAAAAAGRTRGSGDILVQGGRERAKELFREFDVKGVGNRTIGRDRTGGGRSVEGALEDGTPLRLRMKPDGTTRIQAGEQKFIFP
ncbi:MAG: RHS repeat-associated core domain-containing protein [Rubrivivax sp.]|nr:RHS repeat-associated core domain-containing protein [Rubrivivax sp.]